MKKRTQKLTILLLTLFLTLTCFPAFCLTTQAARTGNCDSDVVWSLDAYGTLTFSGNGAVTGRQSYNIGPRIKHIVIESGITSIDDEAFMNCADVISVIIPDSVISIGASAFRNCTALTSITIPNSVISIGNFAFLGCNNLSDVKLSENLISIGIQAFYDCTSLNSIVIPDTVTSIGSQAFYYTNLSNVVHSSGAVEIPFYGSKIKYVTYEDGKYLGTKENPYYAFMGTVSEGVSTITFHKDTKVIASVGASNKSTLTAVTIPEGVVSIGTDAFNGCYALAELTLPESLTYIGEKAFNQCSNLTRINIPAGVTFVGEGAFTSCNRLQGVYITDLKAWCGIEFADNHANPIAWSENLYLNDVLVKDLIIPEGTISIGQRAFFNYHSLSKVVIPDSVTSIGSDAFNDCDYLKSVEIGKGLASLGDRVFGGCEWLSEIQVSNENTVFHSAGNCLINTDDKKLVVGCKSSEIPSDGSVTVIGAYAFYQSLRLSSVVIPEGVTSIEEYAFRYCQGLTSVTIPNSITHIGQSAFETGGVKLTYNTYDNANYLGNSTNPYLVLIGDKTSTVESCIIHSNTKMIYDRAFAYNKKIGSIVIPDSVKYISNFAFSGCSGLSEVTIGDGVVTIGENAFENCSALTSLKIGSGVNEIGRQAFINCSALTGVYITKLSNWFNIKGIFINKK